MLTIEKNKTMSVEERKAAIVLNLQDTGRNGIDELIQYMDDVDFFNAPCSTQYHLAKEGGLAEHSLNVMIHALNMASAIEDINIDNVPYDSIILVSLLHDLGKCGHYGKPNYVENILKSGKRSESKPYTSNPEMLYIPHEIISANTVQKFIELTEEEYFAILHHNGMYGDLKYALNGKERPLQLLLHSADMWASRITEVEENE